MEGDLLCQSLAIEQGAYFDGKSHRSDDPLSPQHGLAGRDDEKVPSLAQQPPQPSEKPAIAIVPSFPEPQGSLS